MEFKIVGAGQSCDFDTGEVVAQLVIALPSGETRVIKTTDETIQQLIALRFAQKAHPDDLIKPPAPAPKYIPPQELPMQVFGGISQVDDDEEEYGGVSGLGEAQVVQFQQTFAKASSVYEEDDDDRGFQI